MSDMSGLWIRKIVQRNGNWEPENPLQIAQLGVRSPEPLSLLTVGCNPAVTFVFRPHISGVWYPYKFCMSYEETIYLNGHHRRWLEMVRAIIIPKHHPNQLLVNHPGSDICLIFGPQIPMFNSLFGSAQPLEGSVPSISVKHLRWAQVGV